MIKGWLPFFCCTITIHGVEWQVNWLWHSVKKIHVKVLVGLKGETLRPFQVKCSYWSVTIQGQLTHSLDKIHFLSKDFSVLLDHSDYYSRPFDCYAEFLVFAVSGDCIFSAQRPEDHPGNSSGVPDTSY